jgi:hypothetical protein
MIINVYCSASRIPVILVIFQLNLNFLDSFSKYTQISNFMKICSLGAALFYSDGQTDRYNEANSCFAEFAKAPKNCPEYVRLF